MTKEGAVHIDFTGVSTEMEAVPPNYYHATVFEASVGPSKSSGQPTLFLQFSISEGEYAGRRLFDNPSLQPQSLWRVKRTLIALGYDAVADLEGAIELVPADLIGLPCVLAVEADVYQGQPRARVTRVLPEDADIPEALDLGLGVSDDIPF